MVDWCGVNDGESEQLAHVSGTVEHFSAAAYCADAAEGFRKRRADTCAIFWKNRFWNASWNSVRWRWIEIDITAYNTLRDTAQNLFLSYHTKTKTVMRSFCDHNLSVPFNDWSINRI